MPAPVPANFCFRPSGLSPEEGCSRSSQKRSPFGLQAPPPVLQSMQQLCFAFRKRPRHGRLLWIPRRKGSADGASHFPLPSRLPFPVRFLPTHQLEVPRSLDTAPRSTVLTFPFSLGTVTALGLRPRTFMAFPRPWTASTAHLERFPPNPFYVLLIFPAAG